MHRVAEVFRLVDGASQRAGETTGQGRREPTKCADDLVAFSATALVLEDRDGPILEVVRRPLQPRR